MQNKSIEKEERVATSPHLLKAVYYGLNNSFGKIIAAGLESSAESQYPVPVVKLLTNTFAGITLSLTEWKQIKSDFPRVKEYFDAWWYEAEKMCGVRIDHDLHHTRLTTCYQQRAVSFGKNEEEGNLDNRDHDTSEPPSKRRCYSPSIILQRVTFERLVEVSECIDIHLELLQREAETVKRCIDTVLSCTRAALVNEEEVKEIEKKVRKYLASEKEIMFKHLLDGFAGTGLPNDELSLKITLFEVIAQYRDDIANRLVMETKKPDFA